MSIEYCEDQLLRLFGSGPKGGPPNRAEGDSFVMYKKRDEYGLSILFCFNFWQHSCSVGLYNRPWETPIVEFELIGVTHFEYTEDTLRVCCRDINNEILLRFQPHLSIEVLDEL